jgi:hypothetical protein
VRGRFLVAFPGDLGQSCVRPLAVSGSELFGNIWQVVREFQQLSLIKRKAELQSRVEGREIPMEEARNWSMTDFICIHF